LINSPLSGMDNLKNKKILITGGDGFLGRHLVKNLLEKRGVLEKNLFLPTFKDIDLRNQKNCQKAVKGQDVVIHLAARVGGIGVNRKKPGEFFYDNLVMGSHLMEEARRARVKKFVAIGTICCYPEITPVPFREKNLWKGYPEKTNAPYGLAKKMLLVQAEAYRQQYGFNAIFLMPVNLYGPGDNFDLDSSHVIPALINRCFEAVKHHKKNIVVWGTGRARREFLFVEDCAEAIILATEKYNRSDPVNIGSGNEISIKKLAYLISKIVGFKGEIIWDKSMPDGQLRRCLDVSLAKKEFGFSARTSFETGLKKTIDWYLNGTKGNKFK